MKRQDAIELVETLLNELEFVGVEGLEVVHPIDVCSIVIMPGAITIESFHLGVRRTVTVEIES